MFWIVSLKKATRSTMRMWTPESWEAIQRLHLQAPSFLGPLNTEQPSGRLVRSCGPELYRAMDSHFHPPSHHHSLKWHPTNSSEPGKAELGSDLPWEGRDLVPLPDSIGAPYRLLAGLSCMQQPAYRLTPEFCYSPPPQKVWTGVLTYNQEMIRSGQPCLKHLILLTQNLYKNSMRWVMLLPASSSYRCRK